MNKWLGRGVVLLSAAILQVSSTKAATNNIDMAVTLDPVIAITTDATNGMLDIPITPTSAGTLASNDLTVSVNTNNLTGYQLTMSSSTANTALVHTADNTFSIPATSSIASAPSALANDTWGYSQWADGQSTTPTTFAQVPALASPDTLRTTTSMADATDTKLTFGVRATMAVAGGTYANTVTFTATGNYVPPPPTCPVLTGKTYLQDIVTPTGPIYGQPNQRVVLKDRRNNQDYYVQNIVNQDGTCTAWMETNLRYEGDGAWDSAWGYDDDRYATTTALAAITANPNDDTNPLTLHSGSSYMGGSQVVGYTTAGFIDPYARGQGTDTLDTTTPTNNTLFYGYLYNWCSAMGGQTGDGTANADSGNACADGPTSASTFDTTTSICPAGWRLPTGNTNGDFYKLNQVVNAGSTTSPQGLIDNFLAVYSGIYTDTLSYRGTGGRYWSSTVNSAMRAYYLGFYAANVYPGSSASNKYDGYVVRCIL